MESENMRIKDAYIRDFKDNELRDGFNILPNKKE